MRQHVPDDEFERRLRDVLHSRQFSVDPAADAIEKIHAGARRRQLRHRAATSGLAAVAVIAVAATGVALRPANHTSDNVAVGAKTPTATAPQNGLPSLVQSPALPFNSANNLPSPLPSGPASAPTSVAPVAPTIAAGGAPPAGFVPMSVTATTASGSTFWVLGNAPCSAGTCTALAKTTNGGKTFTEVGAPPAVLVPGNPYSNDVFGSDTISDVRFVDGSDGWAYGGGLWETTDGGQHWNAVHLTGAVQQLEVASGHVWAIVFTGAASGSGATYQLYTRAYPTGSWGAVAGAGAFGPAEPALAVQDTTVSVVGIDATTGKVRATRSIDATTFAAAPAPPCQPAAGDAMSVSAASLWLTCSFITSKSGGVVHSANFGTGWSVVSDKPSGALTAIGAVDAKSAIVADGEKLVRITTGGATSDVSMPQGEVVSAGFSFIGFTNAQDGFAVPFAVGGRQLWRTTDGGAHWSVVKF